MTPFTGTRVNKEDGTHVKKKKNQVRNSKYLPNKAAKIAKACIFAHVNLHSLRTKKYQKTNHRNSKILAQIVQTQNSWLQWNRNGISQAHRFCTHAAQKIPCCYFCDQVSLPHAQGICFSYLLLHLEHLMSCLSVPWQSAVFASKRSEKKLPFHFNRDGSKQYLYLMSLTSTWYFLSIKLQ